MLGCRQYVPLWKGFDQRKAQQAEREAYLAEKRASQQAAKAKAANRRQPASIVMTEDKRRFVEDILREARAGEGGPEDRDDTTRYVLQYLYFEG